MSKNDFYSSSKWETSLYGGYKGLIMDHPEVHTDWDVEYEIHKHKDLSFYSGSKLIDIFLVKAKEFGLISILSANPDIETRKGFWEFGEKKFAICNKTAQKTVLELIVKKEREYRSLFLHYTETILTTNIMARLPDEDEKGDGSKDEKKKEDKSPEIRGPKSEGEKEGEKGLSGTCTRKERREKKAQNEEVTKEQVAEVLGKLLEETRKREKITPDNITGKLKKSTKWIYPKGVSSKNLFTKEQEQHAKSLVRLLDINFDPAIDRINSLRAGKFDPRKVGEVPAGNLNIYYMVEPNQTTKPFSVVILVDESGSMSRNVECAIDVVKTMYLAFSEILPLNKLSIYGHSGNYNPEIYVYKDPYHDNFDGAIGKMSAKGENYDGPVIECIYERVRQYTEDNIIFIVLSDGEPCGDGYGGNKDRQNLRRIVEKCRRDGFVTIGVGIQHDTGHLYDYNCIVNSLGSDMVKKTSYIINSVVKTEFQ